MFLLVDYYEMFHVFITYSKKSRISNTEYNLPGNSLLSFHVGAGTLHLLFLYELFVFRI